MKREADQDGGSLGKGHLYDDMLHLGHHVSPTHPPMSMIDRAAQFSPFAALTGFEAAIREAGRLTYGKIELNEDEKAMIERRLRDIQERGSSQPRITITYYRPDQRKAGGAYVTIAGTVRKVDGYRHIVAMADGRMIPFEDIRRITVEESEE